MQTSTHIEIAFLRRIHVVATASKLDRGVDRYSVLGFKQPKPILQTVHIAEMEDKDGVRRSNKRSSWAHTYHKSPEDKVNETVGKIHIPLKEAALDPKSAMAGTPAVHPPDRKEMGMSAEALVELKKVFRDAEEDQGGVLDQETFLRTCLSIDTLTALMSEEQLKQLYMKIDANSKGEIGFDDFTSYLLLQQLAKENEPAAEHTTFVRVTTFGSKMYGRCDYEDSESAPSDEEERTADDELWFNPEPVKKEYNDKIGLPRNIIEKIMLLGSLNVYVSSSQEGMLKIWSADNLKPLRTITNGSGAWITDMVVMAQQPMAVFALDRRRVLFRSAEVLRFMTQEGCRLTA